MACSHGDEAIIAGYYGNGMLGMYQVASNVRDLIYLGIEADL